MKTETLDYQKLKKEYKRKRELDQIKERKKQQHKITRSEQEEEAKLWTLLFPRAS